MDIHHGLNGSTSVIVEKPDHSRIFAERGRPGYVQHPYFYQGHEFAHRTYYENGRAYDRFYGRYPYHGVYLEVYRPARYYPVGFYGWAYQPWARPVPYAWGWAGNPWNNYYGYYFTPYPVYSAPSLWLTDYLISASLAAAYAAQAANNQAAAAAAANGPPVMTPQIKQMIADEVKRQVDQENAEAQANANANAQNQPANAAGGVGALLGDNRTHVFVAGSDLDLVDLTGRECAISQGDVLAVSSPPDSGATAVNATVLASKGAMECASAADVSVALTDLQEMQNHMRETIDQGLADLQSKQGQGGLPSAPAAALGQPAQAGFSAGAPPPDPSAGTQIAQQEGQAGQAERETVSTASAATGAGGSANPEGPPPTISLGQSISAVTAALGSPTKIIDLGPKKIYTYSDMKITFRDGKVADVQ
jgi:hypothetical protein